MIDKVRIIRAEVGDDGMVTLALNGRECTFDMGVLNFLISLVNSLQEDHEGTPVPSKKATGTLKRLIDNINEESLKKTRKRMEEESGETIQEEIKNFLEKTGAPYDKEQIKWLNIVARHFAGWQRQQMMKGTKLYGWVARDADGRVHLFEVEPRRLEENHRWWDRDYQSTLLSDISDSDFPKLKWEDEPVCVKVIIIREDQV